MKPIEVFVPGQPKGQPRPRSMAFIKKDGKAGVRVYEPGTAEHWKADIAEAFAEHIPEAPLDCPVIVDIHFYMPRPKGHYGTGKNSAKLKASAPLYCTSKPDRDNMDKAVLDALTGIGMWTDDAKVVSGSITKVYVHDAHTRPGANIRISVPEWQTIGDLPTSLFE